MKTVRLNFELLGYWHAGSGHGRGGDADALVIRDADGLPFLPGKTVKGLLRDACRLLQAHQNQGEVDLWFGLPDRQTGGPEDSQVEAQRPPGELRFTDARLNPGELAFFRQAAASDRSALFQAFSSTRINGTGVAASHTLRTVEVVPPLQLEAEVSGPENDAWIHSLRTAARLVRQLGSHRHRGLGRCRVSLEEIPPAADGTAANSPMPEVAVTAGQQWLEIELLSPAVFSASGATTGTHESLDYIPGKTLLGAVAGPLFKELGRSAADALLTGRIRFGDGLPLAAGEVAWPVPGTYRVAKGADFSTGVSVVNALTDSPEAATARARQNIVDQPLRGVAVTTGGLKFQPKGGFVLKSARDHTAFGRAADAQLFGYATLAAGQKFRACLRWDASDAETAQRILALLTGGTLGLGRSRTAEFGSARVTRVSEPPIPSAAERGPGIPGTEVPHVTFYLASDLALEHAGLPLFDLARANGYLGLPEAARFVPGRSAVRARRYAPWNAFHRGRDRERQVLVRGSVLTFELPPDADAQSVVESARAAAAAGVGEFIHEGLGWVLVNPDFVLRPPQLHVARADTTRTLSTPPPSAAPTSPLTRFARRQAEANAVARLALELGHQWALGWRNLHGEASRVSRLRRAGPSQWNQVRQFAVQARGDLVRLRERLSDHCQNGTRRTYWFADVRRQQLGQILIGKCTPNGAEDGGLPSGPLRTAALAHAAALMVRWLQSREFPG